MGMGREKKGGKLGWEMSWDAARRGVQGDSTDTNCCSQSGRAASPNPTPWALPALLAHPPVKIFST